MLDKIKNDIQNAISVEVGMMTGNGTYPVMVQDIAEGSITKGWSLTYYPKLLNTNGPERLYDGREAFTTLRIANFGSLYQAIMGIDQRFLNGDSVEIGGNNRKRATYELHGARFSAVEYENSVSISLTITHDKSPLHMLNINFRVVDSNKAPGSRYLIGMEDHWDRNTDVFTEENASLTPKKRRMLQVHQDRANGQVTPYIKTIAQQGNLPNTSFVHPDVSPFEYVQDVRNKYKALAYIQEQTIIEIAMEKALQIVNQQSNQRSQHQSFGFGSQTFGSQPPAFSAQHPFAAQPLFGQQSSSQAPQAQPQGSASPNSFQAQSMQWGAPVDSAGKQIF
ncbi:putative ATPase [Paenibacillus sp. TCA20]|uniref:hypothetical protein n=1 Tax=Paenibacillus sp. TCA20 TaxID=1499968 RepID=UPI0004DADCF9|nr:hypothetical protein [Paenibacillus sp. TCA20]GAK41973.1 putative ATPase [Paenibacillus sp. TCA20]